MSHATMVRISTEEPRCASVSRERWTRAFIWVPVAMGGVFGVVTFWLTNQCLSGPDGPHSREWYVWCTAIATPLGPLTGGIARGWQPGCCLDRSLSLLRIAAPVLAVGVAAQFALPASGRWWNRARFVIWTAAWFAWFASGILALGHSLE